MTAIKRVEVLIGLVLLGSAAATPAHATTFVSAGGSSCQNFNFNQPLIFRHAKGAASPRPSAGDNFVCPLALGTTENSPQLYDGVVVWYEDHHTTSILSCRVFQGFQDGSTFMTQPKESCGVAGGCTTANPDRGFTGINYLSFNPTELTANMTHQNINSNYGLWCSMPPRSSDFSWIISYYGRKD